jgi:metal-sulfur cluster biosynthetic enzyme
VRIEVDIVEPLKAVIDPELGVNIVDLGLVYGAEWSARGIEVALTMTSLACPLGEMLVEEAKAVLRTRFGETPSIHVELVWEPPWSPDRMSEQARRHLGWSKAPSSEAKS